MQKTLTQKLTLTGTGVLAVFALAACGTADESPAGAPIAPQDDQATTAPARSGSQDDADDRRDDNADDNTAGSSAAASNGSSAGGSDAAFDAIDAVKAAASGAVVVTLDRDDDDTVWDVTAVEGDEVVEYDVTADGQVTETEREKEQDDVEEAGRAKVTVADAVSTALQGRDGQTVDDVDLDEEDGTLVWTIDFDDADGRDADEVHVDAVTGDVVKG